MRRGTLIISLLLACGDDSSSGTSVGTDAATSTTSTGTGTGSSAGTASSTSTAATTDNGSGSDTATGDGTDGATGGGTGPGTSSSSSTGASSTGSTSGAGSGSSGGGTTGGASVDYFAFALIGALDRVVIRKANFDTQQCTQLILVSPAIVGGFNVTVPSPWSVQDAAVFDSLTSCLTTNMIAGTPDWASAGTGTVDFVDPAPNIYPCELDVNVSLTFEQAQAWAPPSDTIAAVDLVVDGCI